MATQLSALAACVTLGCAPTIEPRGAQGEPPAGPAGWALFDGHVDVMVHYAEAQWDLAAYDLRSSTKGQTNLDRMATGQVIGGFFTCGSPGEDAPRWPGLADCLAFVPRLAARYPDRVMLATTAADVGRARADGKVAWILSVEGGDQIDGDLKHLAELRAAGVRSFGIVYDRDNDLADGAQAFVDRQETPRNGGLSPLGEQAVDELGRLGMLVDVAHAAESTALAVAARSRLPVIASHTAASALVPTPRNASDAVLRAIAATDGVVMVTFLPYLTDAAFARWYASGDAYWFELKRRHPTEPDLVKEAMSRWEIQNPKPTTSITGVADHFEHVARTVGLRHVGIGSDFDGMDYTVPGLEDHRGMPALIAELRKRGWNDSDIDAITSGNILRVLAVADEARR